MRTKVRGCFVLALKDEKKGKKHKGLLITKQDNRKAEEFLFKAKTNLRLCDVYKTQGFEYKIPEEWFYTLYYCALAILSKFGIESRSQKCTAEFLRYAKDNGLIGFSDEFIDRISVYSTKEERSDVDERETARYSSSVKSKDVDTRYQKMSEICRKAISEAEDIIFSEKQFIVPEELYK